MSLWFKDATGAFSNSANQIAKPRFLVLGQLRGIQILTPGSGQTNGAAVSLSIGAPPAGGVQAVGTATIAGGIVTSVTITNPGAGYTTAPTVTVANGGVAATFGSTIRSVGGSPDFNAVFNNAASPTPTVNDSIVFLDATEAQLASNRLKGLDTPGWNRYIEYVNNAGAVRHKVENLVAINMTQATAGDAADDAIAGDSTFTITGQPTNQNTSAGAATFTVTSAGSTFQWQVRPVAGGQFVNASGTIGSITYSGGTTSSLGLTGASSALIANGTQIRCQVYNAASGNSATSNVVTLTYVS